MDLEKAKKVINDGGLVVYPTETAYGIAADALNPEAVERVFEAKNRPRDKGLTVIVDSLETVEKYSKLTENERKVVKEFMPGPLTLVVEKKDVVPNVLNDKFVFRISSGEVADKLAEVGPITATSANISGDETSYSVKDISEELKTSADYVIDTGSLEQKPTSTIAEITAEEITIHREGPIDKDQIANVLRYGRGNNSTSN